MKVWLVSTIGFVLILFILLGLYFYVIKTSVNAKDSIRNDPLPKESEKDHHKQSDQEGK